MPSKRLLIPLLCAVAATLSSCTDPRPSSSLRAPSCPLITIDPYTSIWSPADKLTDATTEHWTGKAYPLLGILTVDGVDYRFLGKEKEKEFRAVAAGGREHNWDGEYSTDGGRSWTAGKGAFGPVGRKPMTGTWINSEDICARRTVNIPDDLSEASLCVTTIGEADFYANGIKVVSTSGRQEIEYFPIPAEALAKAHEAGGSLLLEGRSRMKGKDVFIDMGVYREIVHKERYPLAAEQRSGQVLPMNTVYEFTCGEVALELTFTAPMFLDDLDLLSRPVNYISYRVRSLDGAAHEVGIRFEAGREVALDYASDELSEADTFSRGGLLYARTACTDQTPLWKSGDNVRIDWGAFYLATADKASCAAEASEDGDIAVTSALGKVKSARGMLMAGYDDVYSIQYFGQNLRPWWNRDGDGSIEEQFEAAAREYKTLMRKAAAFDKDLMERSARKGGQKYAEICALAYRQAVSAHKLVESPEGDLLWLSKENNSNGSINTVDVTYPSTPLFFLYNTDLVKGMMNGIFHYSESGRWTKPFPAHDIGTYPLANGQTYGGDMPVEEAGNMLILSAAVCKYDGNADYAAKHWQTLTAWVEYLSEFGLDPEDQLCTDDFAGRFAHNVNLSVKAILGIASYGQMAGLLGDAKASGKYLSKAREMALEWERMASDGDHYRLCFDQSGTWSQKYNLLWDTLLELKVFPEGIMQKEIPYYLTKLNEWGLPLDSRKDYTKTDWIVWTASMGTREQFETLVDLVWKYYNETGDRIPMGDWVNTLDTGHPAFKARSVVGGVFAKLL